MDAKLKRVSYVGSKQVKLDNYKKADQRILYLWSALFLEVLL